jgi:chemotaxis protein methyltransferase CheR
MPAPLEVWDERLRSLFGLSLITHPARLGDGLRAACKDMGIADDAELLARVDGGDRDARTALARALTIGETYFFREPLHFDLLRDSLLPAALARAGEGSVFPPPPVVMVSAACSSGEEAYSMAITARLILGEAAAGRVRVIGFDVNERAVTAARRGVYRAWSLRGIAEDVRRRWFEHSNDEWSVVREARALTTFERRNLVDAADVIPPGSADIVFCRNVLIYFDDAAVVRALTQLAAALRPHGSLIVASAEAGLFAAAGLGARQIGDVWVHTRGDERPSVHAPPARAEGPTARAPDSARRKSALAPVRRPAERRRRPSAVSDAPAEAVPEGATSSSSSATSPSTASSATSPEDVAHYLDRGWSILDANPGLAAEEARRAILLDRTLAAAHVLAASAALAQSDVGGARRALRHARRYLSATSGSEIVRGGGGATAEEMEAYCARLDRALEGRER